ncbi:MAG: phage minor capsid protein [Liquorilactobacillus ghanensis]|uniref:phage minor capsid protein n=1 Tax=Liquorilactobacillus ghanensis TaxID=399370 RepID=UPI0039E8B009
MQTKANQIADYYTDLQQRIFYLLIDASKSENFLLQDSKNILDWKLRMLAKLGALTTETVKLVAKTSKKSQSDILKLIKQDGLTVAADINKQMTGLLNKHVPISVEITALIAGYARQTVGSLNQNVDGTLLQRNYQNNNASKAFEEIINQTALEVTTGLKTPDRAFKDNIYKWRDNGIKTKLTDSAGHNWSLEGYTRMVVNTQVGRTYNDVRIQTMKDFKSPLATMTSHPAARPACAPIQGHVVNVVPESSEIYNDKYPTIYNYGYGTAGGTQGINCGHHLYPYVEGVSHNFQKQYDPDEAIANMQVQQKQRYYERSIRSLKADLDLANRLNDKQAQANLKSRISSYQSKLRDIVKDNDFLTRQYDREQITKK